MPADEDKYPTESGRRRFVKGVVGASTLATVGTGASAAIGSATSAAGAGGGPTTYFGIKNTAGPAPRGMPQIPLTIDSNGDLKGVWPDQIKDGVAVTEIAGEKYKSSWYQYCGVQTYPGLDPRTDQSNYFLSASNPPYEWQSDVEAGTRLNVSMFENYETWGNGIGKAGLGKPAMGTWRSKDLSPQNTIPIQVLRSPKIEQLAQGDSQYSKWLSATTEKGFIAWMDKCTHFCCVPGFKSTAQSAKFNAANEVYCPCHQSVYDPFDIVKKVFIALPRPEE